MIAEGLSNKAIAGQLHLSEHTVKRHVANILTKTWQVMASNIRTFSPSLVKGFSTITSPPG